MASNLRRLLQSSLSSLVGVSRPKISSLNSTPSIDLLPLSASAKRLLSSLGQQEEHDSRSTASGVNTPPPSQTEEPLKEPGAGSESEEEEAGVFVNKGTGEVGGPRGPEPTRYGDWERGGRCSDF